VKAQRSQIVATVKIEGASKFIFRLRVYKFVLDVMQKMIPLKVDVVIE
jgi:hypothetical protein